MLNVGIFLFDNVEVLDFAGPFEVFAVTSELSSFSLLKVFTVSHDGKGIRAVNGLMVQPDYSFETHPQIDILVIPGGVGTKAEIENPKSLDWVRSRCERSQITFSVCSGARILGKLGLLDGTKCTTHHEVIPHLREIAPLAIVDGESRFVDNGKIMTSGGISAGIDLSLHIVRKLFGAEVAGRTIQYMEYGDWK